MYAGGLSPAQVAIASVVQRPITAAALGDPATVDPPAATPKWEIVALHDNAIPTKAEFFMAHRAHAHIVTANSGHDVPAGDPGRSGQGHPSGGAVCWLSSPGLGPRCAWRGGRP